MEDDEFVISPWTRAEARREAELRHIDGWLYGNGGKPRIRHEPGNTEATAVEIEVEVGERPEPPKRGEIREGPGLTVISSPDGMAVKKGSGYTVLTPGIRNDPR